MKCVKDIENLANQKLLEAECLLDRGYYDGAYYHAGYCVELTLKAKICSTLGIPDFFDFSNPSKKKFKNEGIISKAFKVHDLEQLILLSGIYTRFENELINNRDFKGHWSVVSQWSENCRYFTGQTETNSKDFVTSIKHVMEWIQKQ